MAAVFYYLLTFTEAALGVVGIRALYEQPHYRVVERFPGFELREYPARVAAETDSGPDRSDAFRRLFRYITGTNAGGARIAMTAPVAQTGERIAMTVPVQSSTEGGVMRFFLPRDVAAAPPIPLDPLVRIVTVPAETVAVRRFSGSADSARVAIEQRRLVADLRPALKTPAGLPFLLTYDAPFTLPFVRRNEVAVALAP